MTTSDQPIYTHALRTLDGRDSSLAPYRNQVMLIVNVASKCMFTPQYAALEQLHTQLSPRGLVVLGFPCDQFGHQEPDDEQGIARFCTRNYGVSFPMFSKIEVNGPGAHPLFRELKAQQKGLFGSESIKWNFTKFLVGRDGKVLARFAPQTPPATLQKHIEQALDQASAL